MDKIYIRDTDTHGLTFDVKDVLAAIGPTALEAYWTVRAVEQGDELLWVIGESMTLVETLARSEERVSGYRLLEIAQGIHQTIWGEFRGYETSTSPNPSIVIVAVDSSWFEVHSNIPAVFKAVKARFKNTEPPTWSKAWTP